jgi:hypothetical protein
MAAVAVGATSSSPAPPPQKTVTVTIPNAAQDKCITGYVPGILVINSPGGHTQIYTCVQQ